MATALILKTLMGSNRKGKESTEFSLILLMQVNPEAKHPLQFFLKPKTKLLWMM